MATEKQPLALFGVAGVLVAMLIIAGFAFAGNILAASGTGLLTIQIMDKPVELKNLYLTIDSASIQKEDGEWIDLNLLMTEPFDLLALQQVSSTLSETEIPAGSYNMIRIHVSAASAVFAGETEHITLKVPSNVLKIFFEPQLVMDSGDATTVLVDLQPEDLDSIAISNSTNLRPVIRAIVPQPSV